MGLHSMIREAKDPLTPIARLEELGRCGDRDVLSTLAKNPAITLEILEQLARSRQPGVLRAIAAHSRATGSMLHRLAEISIGYAGSPDEWKGMDTLLTFEDDKHFIALEIASRLDTHDRTFHRLMAHPSKSVRFRMAGNPHTPHDLLVRLVRDVDGTVSNRVAEHPRLSEYLSADILCSGSKMARISLARNPAAPVWVLKKLLEERSKDLVRGLLQNPATPLEILEGIREFILFELDEVAHVKDSFVGYLAGHRNATRELASSLPVSGISHSTLERWYGEHQHWDAIRVIFDEWSTTLERLVDSVETIEAL